MTKKFFLVGGIIFCFSLTPFEAWGMGKRPPVHQEAQTKEVKFLSLTLGDCYELALKRSETVAIQKEEIKEAEAQFFKATSEALGDVDFIITNTKQQNPRGGGDSSSVGSSFTDPERLERKFTITQPLFQGFKALGALTGAGSLKKQQKEEWIRAKQLLLLDVVNAFYNFLLQKKDLETVEGIHNSLQERVQELEEREQIGRSRTSEVVTAKTQMKILEGERARIRGSFEVARHLLEFLIGVSSDGRELKDEELSEGALQDLPHYLEVAERRADVEAAKESMKTAKRAVIVAQSEFWPVVSLESNRYQRREGVQANIDWDLLFKIDVPLFRGGGTVGKVKEAVSRWKQKKLLFSLAERKAALEVKEGYQNWLASLEEMKALRQAVSASEENFRLQKDEYSQNLVNNLEVLQALESLHQTRREANHAYYQMKENFWNLRVAAGEAP